MTYVIVNFADVTQAMVDDCIESSLNNLRHTVSGTDKVILKYEGADPSWVASLGLTKYTLSELQTEMQNSEWSDEL